MTHKTNFFYNALFSVALTSDIEQKLAASIYKGGKIIKPCPNLSRNIYRGMLCGSLHAEANAILSYYPKNLNWVPEYGWCFLHRTRKGAKSKKKQVKYCSNAS